jgi:hypothetical protein
MAATPEFDAYHELLGIAPSEQPPNHYRLLGVTLFEATPTVIERAADRQMAHLRSFQVGKHSGDSQRLLNEVSRARHVLLSDTERAAYDGQLRARLAPAPQPAPQPMQPVTQLPLPPAFQQPYPQPIQPQIQPQNQLPLQPPYRPQPISLAPRPILLPQPVPQVAPETMPAEPAQMLVAPRVKGRLRRSSNGVVWLGLISTAAVATVVAGIWVANQQPPPPRRSSSPSKQAPIVARAGVSPARQPAGTVPAPVAPPPSPPLDPLPPMAVGEPTTGETTPGESPADASEVPANRPPSADALQARAEVAAAIKTLQAHPKFKKYYDHLAAHPDTLSVNGPKLAALLMAELQTSEVIREHDPSHVATLQEIARLATAGGDLRLGLAAIEALQQQTFAPLSAGEVRAAKTELLAKGAEFAKPTGPEREALVQELRALLAETAVQQEPPLLEKLLAATEQLAKTAADRLTATQFLLPLAQQAVQQERAAAAGPLLDRCEALLAQIPTSKTRKELADAALAARQHHERLTVANRARQTLATRPQDASAQQALGLYLLLNRSDWKASAEHLAQGTNAEWRTLAVETSQAQTPAAWCDLAEQWARLSTDPAAPEQELARQLVAAALASPELTGIARAAALEKQKLLGPSPHRLPESAAPAGPLVQRGEEPKSEKPVDAAAAKWKPLPLNRWTELLAHIDFDQDRGRGIWVPKTTHPLRAGEVYQAYFRLPAILKNCNYDLLMEVQLEGDHDNVHLVLPVGDKLASLRVNSQWEGTVVTYFQRIPAEREAQNASMVRRDVLRPRSKNRFEIKVRLDGDRATLTFALNGALILEHEGPISELDARPNFTLEPSAQPMLIADETQVDYHTFQVRVVEGTGYLGRDVPLIDPLPPKLVLMKPVSLTTYSPLSVSAHNNQFQVNSGVRNPFIGGRDCTDFIFAHAPSILTYAIPPKAKYFTAFAYSSSSLSIQYTVAIDGKDVFTCRDATMRTVAVEIPEGAKVLQLRCDDLGDVERDHSCWCYPAFRF